MTEQEKKKANSAIDRTNKIKRVAKGLQAIKTISNTLGTSPTETPDVDTKIIKKYGENDGTTGDNSGSRDYKLDENGVGGFDDERRRKS